MSAHLKMTGRLLLLSLVWALFMGCDNGADTATRSATPAASQQAGPIETNNQNLKSQSTAANGQHQIGVPLPPRHQKPAFSARIDPFVPLVESEADPQTAPEPRYRRRPPQTDLETIDLNQLRLTSIFRGRRGPKALLEESDGKGHIVEIGTHLGLRGGRVAQILKDRVIVLEQTEQGDGRVREHRRELHLQYDIQEEPREPSAQ